MNDWAKKIQQIESQNGIAPLGKGWFTMREWQEKLGFGDNKTRRYLRRFIEDGSGKVFVGLQKNTCGLLTRQVWYKLDD